MRSMQRISKLVSILLIFSALGCGKDAVTDKAVTEKAALKTLSTLNKPLIR